MLAIEFSSDDESEQPTPRAELPPPTLETLLPEAMVRELLTLESRLAAQSEALEAQKTVFEPSPQAESVPGNG